MRRMVRRYERKRRIMLEEKSKRENKSKDEDMGDIDHEA